MAIVAITLALGLLETPHKIVDRRAITGGFGFGLRGPQRMGPWAALDAFGGQPRVPFELAEKSALEAKIVIDSLDPQPAREGRQGRYRRGGKPAGGLRACAASPKSRLRGV